MELIYPQPKPVSWKWWGIRISTKKYVLNVTWLVFLLGCVVLGGSLVVGSHSVGRFILKTGMLVFTLQASMLLHEWGHALVFRHLVQPEDPTSMTFLGLFAGVSLSEKFATLSPSVRLAVYTGGPLANALGWVIGLLLDIDIIAEFNAILCLANAFCLIPIMDGGRILNCLVEMVLSPRPACWFIFIIGSIFGLAAIYLCGYVLSDFITTAQLGLCLAASFLDVFGDDETGDDQLGIL